MSTPGARTESGTLANRHPNCSAPRPSEAECDMWRCAGHLGARVIRSAAYVRVRLVESARVARRLRRTAAVTLVILFAHLALMASPLHAAELQGGHIGHPEHGLSLHLDVGHSEWSGGPQEVGHPPDLSGSPIVSSGAYPGAEEVLSSTVRTERIDDCALMLGPAPKRWSPEPGALRTALSALLVALTPAANTRPAVASQPSPRPPRATQLAFLQFFRN